MTCNSATYRLTVEVNLDVGNEEASSNDGTAAFKLVVAIRKNLSFPPNAVLNFATRSGWTKLLIASLTVGCSFTRSSCAPALVSGRIVDDSTGRLIPARIEIRSKAGKWFFPDSVGGSAVRYQKQNWINTNA